VGRVLVVDDEKKMTVILKGALEEEGHTVDTAISGEEALAKLKSAPPYHLILTDLKMSPVDGLEVLRRTKTVSAETDVVLMTAYADAKTAVEAMKGGAYDYIVKPFELDEIILMAAKIIERHDLLRENLDLREALGEARGLGGIVGASEAMKSVFALAAKVAATDATVLITGESGTGKDLLARAIHFHSTRGERPFVKVSCGAVPETLLESDLFGHEKGAFTGAHKSKEGRFETADGGTVFLDEIGEIPPGTQVKLLQVLQEKSFVRLGGTKTTHVDVRIVAATNRDLEKAMKEGGFREDLFYRLNVFPIHIPPLSERPEDVPLLIEAVLKKHGHAPDKITPDALAVLCSHSFPGNVRELENLLERALILAGDGAIGSEHLPSLGGADRSRPEDPAKVGMNLNKLERGMIMRALEKAQGNKSLAARLLGITRRALYSKMETHGIPVAWKADE
jgi:two-component system NtrC family response regulator